MERTITIKAVGKVSQKPDCIRLNIQLTAKALDYNKTMEIASQQLEDLRKALIKEGFKREDLKTSDFNINTVYIYKQNNSNEKVFDGYRCDHSLELSFENDMAKLNKALNAFQTSKTQPEFTISFTIKDQEALKKELLENACQDADEKAEILSKASKVKLGQLLAINYSWVDINFDSETNLAAARGVRMMAMNSMNIEAKDIEVQENVTFVYEIEE